MASPFESSAKLSSEPGRALNPASVNTRYPPAGIIVPGGMRNVVGQPPSSLRNQPPKSTPNGFGLNSSIQSISGGTVRERISLRSTGGTVDSGSSVPGEPPPTLLARQ